MFDDCSKSCNISFSQNLQLQKFASQPAIASSNTKTDIFSEKVRESFNVTLQSVQVLNIFKL